MTQRNTTQPSRLVSSRLARTGRDRPRYGAVRYDFLAQLIDGELLSASFYIVSFLPLTRM